MYAVFCCPAKRPGAGVGSDQMRHHATPAKARRNRNNVRSNMVAIVSHIRFQERLPSLRITVCRDPAWGSRFEIEFPSRTCHFKAMQTKRIYLMTFPNKAEQLSPNHIKSGVQTKGASNMRVIVVAKAAPGYWISDRRGDFDSQITCIAFLWRPCGFVFLLNLSIRFFFC